MDVRDAVEADAERLAELTESPEDVMRNLVHDRTVRVGVVDADIVGFVSFDAQRDTVYVTQLEGPSEARERLLEEPIRFARNESMQAELLVSAGDEPTREIARDAAFVEAGNGPRFEGTETVRYRWTPS
ncbi:hypothetical protein ACFQPA_11050 [Halomarina halobia]|uniref:N-acetyltransferase domain-containing protein n=1 Tax=Halomarina halobia TaxID=3033386 RepID=A0ABD6A9U2_9EURY|nr:hypothetical protein [Halomarina sp. PSR21]